MFDVYGDAAMIVISYMSVAKRRRKNLREKKKVLKWRLNMCSNGDDMAASCGGDAPSCPVSFWTNRTCSCRKFSPLSVARIPADEA